MKSVSKLSLRHPLYIVIKQGDEGVFMLVIYEGKARVIVDGHEVAVKNPNDVVGESAL
jgi:hypothetical protein